MPSSDERRGAYAFIMQKPIAVDFVCPWCDKTQSVDIDQFVWEDLWDRQEGCECPECGREVRFNEGVELY